jgi:hypothetical protein
LQNSLFDVDKNRIDQSAVVYLASDVLGSVAGVCAERGGGVLGLVGGQGRACH